MIIINIHNEYAMRINQMNFSSENAHASVAYLSLPIIFPNIFSANMVTFSGR